MKVIAVSNQKGGVGKTTTSANLGAAIAERGFRVLVIDLDPQGNLSYHLGVDIYKLEKSVYDVLTSDMPLAEIICETGMPNLFCAPSNIDLAGAEVEMVAAVGRETILKDAIDAYKEEVDLDYVLIDCPPSLGLLCVNGLAAADEIIIPMQTEFFALQGMGKLVDVMDVVKKRINPRLELGGIVACRMDTRTRLALEVLEEIRAHFGDKLFETRIRQNVKLAEAPSHGKTVFEYASDSNGAHDYRELAAEYLGLDSLYPRAENDLEAEEADEDDEDDGSEIAAEEATSEL